MEKVEVVVAHKERETPRVGNVFLKIDGDQTRTDVEVEAMAMAPVPTLGAPTKHHVAHRRRCPYLAIAGLLFHPGSEVHCNTGHITVIVEFDLSGMNTGADFDPDPR